MMHKFTKFLITIVMVSLSACNNAQKSPEDTKGAIVEVVAPQAMHTILKNDPDAQLVDVRTSEEYGVSHLKDSQNICVTDVDFKSKAARLDKDKPVYVYCKRGGRSAKAATVLKEMGFTKIYDLQGGITAWNEEKLQTEQ